MDTSVIAISQKSAILFVFKFGLWLGTVLAIVEIVAALIQRKLNIKQTDLRKYLAVLISVGIVEIGLYNLYLHFWGTSYDIRAEFFDRNVQVIGYVLFFWINLLGMSVPMWSGRALANRILDSPN